MGNTTLHIHTHTHTHTHTLSYNVHAFTRSHPSLLSLPPLTESDEHGTPPPRRQRAASIPRNAEELACHVLHGSLRLTPSRQQILSHSGIRLEERATSMQGAAEQQGQQQNSQTLPHPLQTSHHTAGESSLLQSRVAAESANQRGRLPISVEGADSNSDSDDENSSESSSSSSEEEGEEEEEERGGGRERERRIELSRRNSRSSSSPQKRARGRHKDDVMVTSSPRERRNSNRRPRSQLKSRRRPSSALATPRSQPPRSKRKTKATPRSRLDSGGVYSSTSEAEFPVNGTSRPHPHVGVGGNRDLNRITREESKCSSVYETANEGYLSIEEKTITSPLSDAPGGIPKATGIEELTARNLLTVPKQQSLGRGKKRQRSTGAATDRGKKKSRLESRSSTERGTISKPKMVNGLVNGSGVGADIKPLDLVWAKCRGYPPYPALVSDVHSVNFFL